MAGSADRRRLLDELSWAGRESSRLSVLLRHGLAARLGLNVTDGECLDFILEKRSVSAGELAELTGLTTGAITSVIRRLQAAGFVRTKKDPGDRRRVIVTPVAERAAEGAELYRHWVARAHRALTDFSNEDLGLITSYLRAMTAVYGSELTWLDRDRSERKRARRPRSRTRPARRETGE